MMVLPADHSPTNDPCDLAIGFLFRLVKDPKRFFCNTLGLPFKFLRC